MNSQSSVDAEGDPVGFDRFVPPSMQAAVVRALPTRRMEVEVTATPRVEAPDHLLLRVEACGICGTDLHILDGASYRPTLPFVLGHEAVGTVVETGSDAARWVGRRVTMTNFTGCGRCDLCRDGDERLCPELVSITGVLGSWGGFAGYTRIHAAQAIEVPPTLDAIGAASLVDAGATAANSVRVAIERSPERVLLIGAGPIGFLCAELLKMAGVQLDVVHPSPLRRQALAAIGHNVVASFDELRSAYDVVIDCAGVPEVIAPGLARLGPKGAYLLAGYAKAPNLDLAVVARREGVVRGIRSGRRSDLESVISAAAGGSIRIPGVTTWPLAAVNDALDALRSRAVPGKAVVIPTGQR